MAELPLADRSISEVLPLLDAREISSRDLVEACLARIGRDAERLNTFLAVGAEQALAAAEVADGARADGVTAPLLGISGALVVQAAAVWGHFTLMAQPILQFDVSRFVFALTGALGVAF